MGCNSFLYSLLPKEGAVQMQFALQTAQLPLAFLTDRLVLPCIALPFFFFSVLVYFSVVMNRGSSSHF
jgi:hypothetical protein